jgi:hypothetical protein
MSGFVRLIIPCLVLLGSGVSAAACTLAFASGFRAPEGRIAGIELALSHGAVASVGEVPAGWRLVIDNDPSWNMTVSGQAIVGAAFLPPATVPALSFMIVPEPGHACSAPVAPDSLKLKLRIYRADKLRDVVVPASSLVLTE